MEDRKILDLYPLPVARGYRRFRNAVEPRERHDAAYYLFEVYIKYAATISIALYLAGDRRDHKVNAALKGLARPSLGEWMRFLRECLRFLGEERGADPLAGALAELFKSKEDGAGDVVQLCNALRKFRTGQPSEKASASIEQLLEEVVAYRNRVLGHGAQQSADHYRELGELLGRAFIAVLQRSSFLTVLRLAVLDSFTVQGGGNIECGVLEYVGTPHPLG